MDESAVQHATKLHIDSDNLQVVAVLERYPLVTQSRICGCGSSDLYSHECTVHAAKK